MEWFITLRHSRSQNSYVLCYFFINKAFFAQHLLLVTPTDNTVWPKVCGQFNIALVCDCWTSHSETIVLTDSYGKILVPGCKHLLPQEHYWGWEILRYNSPQKVLDGVNVRALCRPAKYFHTRLGKPIRITYGSHTFDHKFTGALSTQNKQHDFCTSKIS